MSSNENEEVSVVGTLTFEDYKKHNFYHQRKIVIGYFFFALLLLIYMCTILFSGSWIIILPVSLIISSIISGFITLLLVLLIHFRVRREYKSDQLIKNEISYIVNNYGINQKIKSSNSYFEWNDIITAYEHKEMFRLYISKNKAIILPKRYFNSHEDITSFKILLSENLNFKKVKLK